MQNGKVGNTSKISAEVSGSSPPKRPTSKQKRVESELKKLREITKGAIPDEKRKTVMPLLANLAFLKVKLDDARADLLYEDIFIEYDNGGGQTGLREHPGFSAYNKLFTTFSRGVKQLTDMMPNGTAAADALIDFINETRYG